MMKTNIEPLQKLKDGDCVYNLTNEQAYELLSLSNDDWFVQPSLDGLVFSDKQLYPTYLEFCAELEEYNFSDFRQLCINTFVDGN